MRRSVPVIVIVLAALAAAAGYAKNPPSPPAGTWDLMTTRATYSGPATAVRTTVTRLVRARVTFIPNCTPTGTYCDVTAVVTTRAGRRVKFKLQGATQGYVGSTPIRTGLRCAGRRLTALVALSARMIQRQQPGDVLTGTTQITIENPGSCKLFAGRLRALRKTWFTGAQVS